ncbi:MAG TPA: glycosyltransferase [Gemmatimonadaceae bacterium]|nr:glycosyltransferase [Gemmatimonadaceae bacterium]
MICLNMIVKNEAHCIARCLRSVRPYVDAAVIVDTGSTDETCAIIEAELPEKTVLIFKRPWTGFGPNRTEAARLCKPFAAQHPDAKLLFIDADETLKVTGDFSPPDADLVVVSSQYPEGVEGTDRLLARASIPWVFEPITHETIRRADGLPLNVVRWDGARIIEHNDSARRNSGEKNSEDARLLSEWVKDHPRDERAWFYLGQALRNIGELEAAGVAYVTCVNSNPTHEHAFFSLLCIGHIAATIGIDPRLDYTRAYATDRDRAEPLCSLAEWYIGRGDFLTAELYARQACALQEPEYGIFLDRSVYRWKRWSTLGKALCGAGRLREALELHSVDRGEPPEEKARIAAGMAWIREKLGA